MVRLRYGRCRRRGLRHRPRLRGWIRVGACRGSGEPTQEKKRDFAPLLTAYQATCRSANIKMPQHRAVAGRIQVPSRWTILAVLFVARAAFAFQFGSVGAVAPQLRQSLGASLADIGILIGIYFAPGVLLAFPAGTIGHRHGDKATVLAALLAMLTGELLMTSSASWSVQIAGRLIAGTGGILLSVLMTKMVADWFAGREIATAMAIFVNSWPVGIAISLMLLPWIGARFGLPAVNLAVAGWIMIGFGLMAFFLPRARGGCLRWW